MYERRFYRDSVHASNLRAYTVVEKETDLQIYTRDDLTKATKEFIRMYRQDIENYIAKDKTFLLSLSPIKVEENASPIVQHMGDATSKVKVGPMAAVAGAMAEYVGRSLLELTDEVIIENGGDIFIKTRCTRKILIYAGNSPFSNSLAIEISPEDTPLGICTSAGTVGHSLSFGIADAVVVLSKDTLLADATATAIGNHIKTEHDIEKGIALAESIEGIEGILIIVGDKMGAWGNIKLIKP